ncbi:ABC transporter permease [Paenibacillus wynnii]|uniref:ABC transporter permease n=1 Tax=Paenibacillus wynnii TaxID=268407 RepID=UPI00278FB86B|nr:FtsX-like permease family protein [Paenibacillus wynnii]MDQ0195440.1 ABC-type antimicrobial peptide transport system permease subunit [Paenibacillus wynnii]
MTTFDLIHLALINFLRSKVRSFLTILGVVIGTAAIVVMLSLGIGMNESFKQQVSQMGSLTIINVFLEGGGMGGKSGGTGMSGKLDDRAIQTISGFEGVDVATPMIMTSAKLEAGKYLTYMNLVGIRPEALEKLDFIPASGRLLTSLDNDELLFGSQLSLGFYNPKSSMGYGQAPPVDVMKEKMQMTFDMAYGDKQQQTPEGTGPDGNKKPAKLYKVKAVGMLAEAKNEKDWSVYINIDYLQKLLRENAKTQKDQGMAASMQQGYQQAIVRVKDMKDVEPVREKIKSLGFGTSALTDVLKGMQETSRTIQMILGGIGAISLLVAALGITNTMVMSIYERTREIGIMKVLGCELGDIRKLFLMEAGFIGFLGGLSGVLFSLAASFVLNKFGGGLLGSLGGGMVDPNAIQTNISVIPFWLMLSSIAFATLVGLVSGFYPARRAMRLSALEAIKTE